MKNTKKILTPDNKAKFLRILKRNDIAIESYYEHGTIVYTVKDAINCNELFVCTYGFGRGYYNIVSKTEPHPIMVAEAYNKPTNNLSPEQQDIYDIAKAISDKQRELKTKTPINSIEMKRFMLLQEKNKIK